MDSQLLLLQQKIDQLPMTSEERFKYFNELSLRIRAKLLDVIYGDASESEKKKLMDLTDAFNLKGYLLLLKKKLQNKELLEKIKNKYTEELEKEIKQFP